MDQLTERQQEILNFIRRRIDDVGYPPTIREIGLEMGIRSTNGVNDHLKALERKGYLTRDGLKSRALRPAIPENSAEFSSEFSDSPGDFGFETSTEDNLKTNNSHRLHGNNFAPAFLPDNTDFIEVQVLGRVAAGQPILAEENVETTVRVDQFFLGGRSTRPVFALRVTGDSMIEAGIFDGDYIFVRKQLEAHAGEIVVAMIDGEATVKRFEPKGDTIHFVPENREMEPIIVRKQDFRNTSILGIVCGVYRKMS